jgi:symplekin
MSAEEIINGLNQAQQLIYSDPSNFPKILSVVSQMADGAQLLPVQQWCSQFFQDWFSPENKLVPFHVKQSEAGRLVFLLLKYADIKDVYVYKNVVLTATSIYELVFDLISKTLNVDIWKAMNELKAKILNNWQTSFPLTAKNPDKDRFRSIGSKIASVKFISKIIVIQSPAGLASRDPRRRDNNGDSGASSEISVASVQQNHPVLNKITLDAEAKSLLDSLLNYFKEESYLVSQVFISILNNLIYIIQRRKIYSTKILHDISTFEITKKYQFPKDKFLKYKLECRFVERSIKNALNYANRAGLVNQQSSVSQKFQKLVTSINSKHEEQKKKGILNQIPGEVPNKKQSDYLPFPNDDPIINDNSYNALYQLIDSTNELVEFDVTQVPTNVLTSISLAALHQVDVDKLITALSIVSTRYADLINKSNKAPVSAKTELKEEEDALKKDDNDNDQILANSNDLDDDNLQTTFVLPPPRKLSIDDKTHHLNLIVQNFFKLSKIPSDDKSLNSFNLSNLNDDQLDSSIKISKIAINDWKKNSWLIILTRLATRGLRIPNDKNNNSELCDLIRNSIFDYFLENIHDRIEIIIEWLNEEWFSEFNSVPAEQIDDESHEVQTPTYLKWTEKVLDSMIPFLESNDRKIFIRLLSDLPFLNSDLVSRVKSLCIDPQRTVLGFQSLQFLIMFRPPVKKACLNILKDLYDNNEDLKEKSLQLLKKYDEDFTEQTGGQEGTQ